MELLGDADMTNDNDDFVRYLMFNTERINFPDFCPVCEEPADDTGIIGYVSPEERVKAEQLREANRTAVLTSARMKMDFKARPGSLKRLAIPTCQEHAFRIDETGRSRGATSICFGVALLASILWTIVVTFATFRGMLSDPFWYLLLLGVYIVTYLSYLGIGPSGLEQVIEIISFHPGGTYVILKITSKRYYEELIRLNPMTAKRVKPIRMGEQQG